MKITIDKQVVEQALDALCAVPDSSLSLTRALRTALEASKEVEPVALDTCNPHPDAPHGFCRNESISEDRYVCECEYWEPPHPAPAVPVDPCAECKSLGETSAAMCKQCERDTTAFQELVKAMLAAAPEVK